ncbi:MAG: SDR family oxidoreductase [Minicystis sp.]
MRLQNRVVFITGASRGIGRAVALACAREGADIVVAAKTEVADNPRLPGTIHDVAREVEALGRRALPLKLDVRDADACEAAVEKAVAHFGRIDALVNNAGALWWADVVETPVKKFDLIMGINVRASFVLAHAALPHMIKHRWGHIVMMSPPVDAASVAHHGAYAVSKFGMTMIAQSIADEAREHNVTAHALWPATAIESFATMNFGLGGPELWRKADILADATVALLSKEPSARMGRAWIDEELLRSEGVTDFREVPVRARLGAAAFPLLRAPARHRDQEVEGSMGYKDDSLIDTTIDTGQDIALDPMAELDAVLDDLDAMLKNGEVIGSLTSRGINASIALLAVAGLRAYLQGNKADAAEDLGTAAEEISGRITPGKQA